MERIFLLLLFIQVVIQQTSSNLEFGEVNTIFNLNTTFPWTGTYAETRRIRFIHQNRNNPEIFLVGIAFAIFEVPILSRDTSTTKLIVGDPDYEGYVDGPGTESRFRYLAALVQTTTGYIVTDRWNNCLRLIQSSTSSNGEKVWQTSTYAGECGVFGALDGPTLDARFRLPQGMIERGNVLYITDSVNREVRQIDINSGEVTTIHEVERFIPGYLAFGAREKEFFVTAASGILRIQNNKESWLVGCEQSTYGQVTNARFSTAEFTSLESLVKLNENILLVATGESEHTIKVVDLDLQEVDVICTGQEGDVDGDVRNCKLTYATSITVLDDVILIGEINTIRRVPYYFSNTSSIISSSTAHSTIEPTAPVTASMIPTVTEQSTERINVPTTDPNSTTKAKISPGNDQTSTSTSQDNITTTQSPTEVSEALCEEPRTISNTRYTTLDSYTEGTEIYYQCIDSYMLVDEMKNKLTCTSDGSRMFWSDEKIQCRPSKSLVVVMVISPIYIITILVLVLVIVKLYREQQGLKRHLIDVKNEYMEPSAIFGQLPRPYRVLHLQQQASANEGESDSKDHSTLRGTQKITSSLYYVEPN